MGFDAKEKGRNGENLLKRIESSTELLFIIIFCACVWQEILCDKAHIGNNKWEV